MLLPISLPPRPGTQQNIGFPDLWFGIDYFIGHFSELGS